MVDEATCSGWMVMGCLIGVSDSILLPGDRSEERKKRGWDLGIDEITAYLITTVQPTYGCC